MSSDNKKLGAPKFNYKYPYTPKYRWSERGMEEEESDGEEQELEEAVEHIEELIGQLIKDVGTIGSAVGRLEAILNSRSETCQSSQIESSSNFPGSQL